jgi:acylphosphatase
VTPEARSIRRIDVTVHGRVQGVGYRIHVARLADRLGLTGWVANEADGGVRCVAEGAPDSLSALLEGIRDGPPGARVDAVSDAWSVGTGAFGSFEVRARSHGGD